MERYAMRSTFCCLFLIITTMSANAQNQERARAESLEELTKSGLRQITEISEGSFFYQDVLYITGPKIKPDVFMKHTARRYSEKEWRVDVNPRSPFARADAPIWVEVPSGKTFSTRESVALHHVSKELKQVDVKAEILSFSVTQVATDASFLGTITSWGRSGQRYESEGVQVEMIKQRPLIDGQRVTLTVVRDGRYRYTTVRGAGRTVAKYRELDFPIDVLVGEDPADAEDVFSYLITHDVSEIPRYTPKIKVVTKPEYARKSRKRAFGNGNIWHDLKSKGTATLEWVERGEKLRIIKKRN